jgi:uracil DNA glycosylase
MSASPDDPNGAPTPADDPLGLAELFQGGGEPWLPLLKPTIEAQPNAAAFIGPGRDPHIVPVRELTFQALKPNPPARWKVVIFGQNPYPRVESATGIAMFDNTFHNWGDSQFGRVMSIRCIIKAACMWKHGIGKQTPIAAMRKLLTQHKTVQPPEWFQAMLTQGVLLLNAALTASSDGALATEQHTAFWRPVAERVIEEILRSKQGADDAHRGVVFAWWGGHARMLRAAVERLERKYPNVPVRHVDHCNPAAQGDIFCDGNHFADINAALRSLHMGEVDWLPSAGWSQGQPRHEDTAGRMGAFIATTMELHQMYLERLQSVKDEVKEELPAVVGVLDTPLMPFREAAAPLVRLLQGLDPFVKRSHEFARQKAGTGAAGALTEDEIAALYLYTCESCFYRQMNATLRDANRARVAPYFPYLRLFFSALSRLTGRRESLWRGVALDLRPQYPRGGTVTWWGVSSCTSKLAVAQGFLGGRGRRTLFEVIPLQAVSIRSFSAFTGEEEYVLPPGTRLKVTDLKSERGGLCTIRLEELAGQRQVS